MQRLVNQSWRVTVDAEFLSGNREHDVDHLDAHTHPKAAIRHRQREIFTRVSAGSSQQLLDGGITSNGAVKRHNVGLRHGFLQLHKIPLPLLYPVRQAQFLGQFLSSSDIR